MALLFMESFDAAHVNLDTAVNWWNVGSTLQSSEPSSGTGRRGTDSLVLYGQVGSQYDAELDLQSSYDELVIGFAIKPTSGGTATDFILSFTNSTDGVQFVVELTNAGRVRVLSGAGGSVLAQSSDGAITFDIYQYFEIKLTCDGSAGIIQVRVDGSDVISETTGLNTKQSGTGTIRHIIFRGQATSSLYKTYYDDLYVCDQTGTSLNDFLGDVKIDAFFPDADGNHTDFTPSTGTDHFDVVDDNGTLSDDEYVESDTTTERDSYDVTPTGDLPTIYAISLRNASRNPDTGVAEGTPFVRMSSVDYDQATFDRGDTVEQNDTIITSRPDTGGVWTKNVLLTTEIGVEFSNAS